MYSNYALREKFATNISAMMHLTFVGRLRDNSRFAAHLQIFVIQQVASNNVRVLFAEWPKPYINSITMHMDTYQPSIFRCSPGM